MKTRAERYRVSFRIVWDDGESFHTGAIADISESGLFVDTTLAVDVGQAVTVIPLVDGDAPLYQLRGRVVRRIGSVQAARRSGIGIQIDPLPMEQLSALRALLADHRTQ